MNILKTFINEDNSDFTSGGFVASATMICLLYAGFWVAAGGFCILAMLNFSQIRL